MDRHQSPSENLVTGVANTDTAEDRIQELILETEELLQENKELRRMLQRNRLKWLGPGPFTGLPEGVYIYVYDGSVRIQRLTPKDFNNGNSGWATTWIAGPFEVKIKAEPKEWDTYEW